MEDLVLTIPTQDLGIMETLAARMGWTVRSKRSIVQKFVDSCPKTPMMTDDEIAAEVNADFSLALYFVRGNAGCEFQSFGVCKLRAVGCKGGV